MATLTNLMLILTSVVAILINVMSILTSVMAILTNLMLILTSVVAILTSVMTTLTSLMVILIREFILSFTAYSNLLAKFYRYNTGVRLLQNHKYKLPFVWVVKVLYNQGRLC